MLLFKNGFKLLHSNLKASYSNMLGVRVEFEIILPIIRLILFTAYRVFSPFMMNCLPSFKWASKHFRYYKTMLINLASFICHRVIRQIKFDITMADRFSMQRFSSALLFPSKLSGTMQAASCKNFMFPSFIKIVDRNPSILFALTTGNNYSKPTAAHRKWEGTNRIPMYDGASNFNNLITNWSLFSRLCHYISPLDIIPYLKEQYNRRLCNAISARTFMCPNA